MFREQPGTIRGIADSCSAKDADGSVSRWGLRAVATEDHAERKEGSNMKDKQRKETSKR